MDTERRKFSRISCPGEDCEVDFGKQRYPAKLVDESINGFSIGGVNVVALAKNLPIRLHFRQNTILGSCKNVLRSDTGIRIGIERSYSSTTDALHLEEEFNETQYLINPFIEFQGNFVKCVPLEMIDERTVRVVLWNGKPFDVKSSSIHALTREERGKHLHQEQVFEMIQRLYSLGENGSSLQNIEEILDFEFGSEEADDLFDCLSRCETMLNCQ